MLGVERPEDRPDNAGVYERLLDDVPRAEQEWLYALPERVELDGVLYVHGSPLSDVDSFPPQPDLVNPGSVAMPLDGDRRAAWATWDRDFALRRVAAAPTSRARRRP